MRYANHADSEHANAEPKVVFIGSHYQITLVAKLPIMIGQEILFNYNF